MLLSPGAPYTPIHTPNNGYPDQLSDSRLRAELVDSQGYFLGFCTLVSSLAAACLALVILTHLACLLAITQLPDMLSVYDLIYRLYGLIFACIGFMCEMEWTETIRTTSLLQYWTTRGLFYAFVALFTVREYGEVRLPLLRYLDGQLLVLSLGSALGMVGVLYSAMGLFCLKKIRDQKMARYMRMLSGIQTTSSYDTLMQHPVYGYSSSGTAAAEQQV